MPNVVKGSKQRKMIVVPYRPKRQLFYMAALIFGVAISAFGGFLYGYYETRLTQQTVQADRTLLTRELARLETENSEFRRQVAILSTSSRMDQQANEEVQSTISGLRARVAQLEQDVVFYRRAVAEDIGDTGLTIGQFSIVATRDANRFRYKLVMRQQDADGDTYLIGYVNVNLIGRQGDKQVILPLREISEDEEQLDIRLRFKYFQPIEGELVLPAGFEPDRIQIAAVATAPVEKNISQNFSWVVQGE